MLFCGTPEREVSPHNSGGTAARRVCVCVCVCVCVDGMCQASMLDAYDKVRLGANLFCVVLSLVTICCRPKIRVRSFRTVNDGRKMLTMLGSCEAVTNLKKDS
jgi:hypothetical protein